MVVLILNVDVDAPRSFVQKELSGGLVPECHASLSIQFHLKLRAATACRLTTVSTSVTLEISRPLSCCSRMDKPAEKKRRLTKTLCPHCNTYVSKSTWYRHYRECYNTSTDSWVHAPQASVAQFYFADIGNSSGDESAVDNQNTFLDTDEIGPTIDTRVSLLVQ